MPLLLSSLRSEASFSSASFNFPFLRMVTVLLLSYQQVEYSPSSQRKKVPPLCLFPDTKASFLHPLQPDPHPVVLPLGPPLLSLFPEELILLQVKAADEYLTVKSPPVELCGSSQVVPDEDQASIILVPIVVLHPVPEGRLATLIRLLLAFLEELQAPLRVGGQQHPGTILLPQGHVPVIAL